MATLIWQGTAALLPADGFLQFGHGKPPPVGGPLRVVRLADRRGVCLVSAEGRRKGRGNMAASTLMDQDLFGPCVLFDSAEFGELPEGLDRRFPVERPVYAPVLSETEPTAPVDTSLVGREREVADAWYCLALLRAKGGGVGRRVGIAIRNIVGAAGNRHNAGDVVLFCDWEPSEMELGMAEGTCWVRPEGWDRILVDTPLPPEAIEERIKRRRRLYTHNMVYGVSGSSVIEVGAVRSAESAVSASRSAEAIPNSVSEGRRAARVAQGVQVAEQVTRLEAMIVRFQAVQESLEESRHQAEAVSEAVQNVAADSQAAAAALQHQMDRVSGDMAALRDTQAQAARMASKWHSRVLAEIEEAKAILSGHLEAL